MARKKKVEILPPQPEEPDTYDELDVDADVEPDFEAEEVQEEDA